MMELGYKLSSWCEEMRLSQKEMADLLNISQKTYSDYQSFKTTASANQFSKLCEFLIIDFISHLKKNKVLQGLDIVSYMIQANDHNIHLRFQQEPAYIETKYSVMIL